MPHLPTTTLALAVALAAAAAPQVAGAARPTSGCIKPYSSTPVACVLPASQNQLDGTAPVSTKSTKSVVRRAPCAIHARCINKTHKTKQTPKHHATEPACYIPYTHLPTTCILPAR